MNALIGFTGFVGENLLRFVKTDTELYNSKNIQDIHNKHFKTLYISAIQAKKWWANQNPEEDKQLIDNLFSHLENVEAERVVFISTVDVYQPPLNSDEDTVLNADIHAYGANRLYAEEKVKLLFNKVHIIRLQGLVASNLSKNVIFDLKNKNILETINPDSSLQWYPLQRLYTDINTVIYNDIDLVNLSVEPITTKQIIDIAPLTRDESQLTSSEPASPVHYNVKSKYASLFGGHNGYVVSAEESLNAISQYFAD
ncbi:hypothetical protein [uncultured Alteromonas sp.]|jgi:hypothetical protein|uniref:hypothetical protein n=1 Tax=uncultured Alteromonas sp. TaxID=179113 RepID=UPI0030EDB2B9|tara:strand:- start:5085 stop:5849 length:765 start_codon:yes stop_codon:yes gene_type:complete